MHNLLYNNKYCKEMLYIYKSKKKNPDVLVNLALSKVRNDFYDLIIYNTINRPLHEKIDHQKKWR